jgi:tripartite-type tricarboxylate transporter receptor subunit TctC
VQRGGNLAGAIAQGGQHELPRRGFLHLAAGATAAIASVASAQTYPARPITLIVPVPAGGQGDALAQPMRNSLGRPIIIENVSGAAGSIGTGRVARARPDGYTIDLGLLSTHVLNGLFASIRFVE